MPYCTCYSRCFQRDHVLFLNANVEQLGKHNLNIGIFQMTEFDSLYTKSAVHIFFPFIHPIPGSE